MRFINLILSNFIGQLTTSMVEIYIYTCTCMYSCTHLLFSFHEVYSQLHPLKEHIPRPNISGANDDANFS